MSTNQVQAAVNARYITYPISTNPQDLMLLAFNYLQTQIPGWQPSEGQLDVWLIEAISGEAADIGTLASEVPKSIFRWFGSTIVGIPPVDSSSASCTATFYSVDILAHSIPSGTQVGIRDPSGNLVPFEVLFDVQIPNGGDNADVTLVASLPGANGSGLGSIGGTLELIDVFDWVASVTQKTVTAGGSDAETDDEYLNRLTLELQTISPRPILPIDFSILARNVSGVQRATTLDNYNPITDTFGNERMVTVVSIDANGAPVSTLVRSNVQMYLDAMREINFVVNTMDANVREIDFTVAAKMLPGYNTGDVSNRIEISIMNWIDPAVWGLAPDDDPTDPQIWVNNNTVRYLDLATVVNNVSGVDYIQTLTMGPHGGTQTTTDYVMAGRVPLPLTNVNDITVTVNA